VNNLLKSEKLEKTLKVKKLIEKPLNVDILNAINIDPELEN
jgi:hypothetical protein